MQRESWKRKPQLGECKGQKRKALMPCTVQHKVHYWCQICFYLRCTIIFCCSKRSEEYWSDLVRCVEHTQGQEPPTLKPYFTVQMTDPSPCTMPCKIFMTYLCTQIETKLVLLKLLPHCSHESLEQCFTVWFNT